MRNLFYDPIPLKPKHEYEIDGDVARIKINDDVITLVDLADLADLILDKWQVYNGKNTRYVTRSQRLPGGKKITIAMHREIMGLEYGDGKNVDHINRDGLDNRTANLRLATAQQNAANRIIPRVKTPYRGVQLNNTNKGKKWAATIRWRYRKLYLGSFETAEEAAREYDIMAHKLFGEFAVLNFPDDLIDVVAFERN